MGCLCGGGQSTQSQSGTSNGSSSGSMNSSTTPNLPDWWTKLYNSTSGQLSPTGMTSGQQTGGDYLQNNVNNNPLNGALTTSNNANATATAGINNAAGNVQTGADYLQGQLGAGSNTLTQWFPGQVASTNAPSVNAGTGAAYMGAYQTPLNTDYVNNSLASFDQGAANDYNTLRAQNADAFGNKRTGVAEGQFQATNALNRGTLASQLNLNAFNTAAGLGQTDASRALTADTTNAGNLLNNSQFNTNLTNNRQQFDVNQADTGQQMRDSAANSLVSAGATGAGVSSTGSNIGTSGVNSAIGVNNAGVGNATALGQYGNMSLSQLMQLLGLGQSGIGSSTSGTTSGTSNSSSYGNGTSSTPGNLLGAVSPAVGAYFGAQ